jgi:uncharacterized membrane protein
MRFLGHPVHAVLVAFPIGLLTLVPCWDVLALLGTSGASTAGYLGEITRRGCRSSRWKRRGVLASC